MNLDAKVIVKLNNLFYPGNLFIDDGLIAIAKFSSFLDDIDVSTRRNIDLSILYEIFEDYHCDVYDQIVEFYDKEDYLCIVEDILKSIQNKKVIQYCRKIAAKMEDEADLEIIIDELNLLLKSSQLNPENLPVGNDVCILHATRNLFPIYGRKSRLNSNLHRFTIPTKVLEKLKDKKHTVRIEFIHSKVLFHVTEGEFNQKILLVETRKFSYNGDNSYRLRIPENVYKKITKTQNETELFLILKPSFIEFSICEI